MTAPRDRARAISRAVNRFRSLRDRRRRARQFVIPYTRDRNWKTPQYLKVGAELKELALPDDAGTAIAFKDIFLSDVYGLEALREPPKKIIDIGAHAGLFGLASRLHFPNAVIHAYEPNPSLWPYLDHQGEIGQFTAFHEAVGLRQGKAVLEFGADTVFTRCVPSQSGEIEVTAISEAICRMANGGIVDLLKLDCEGAEWDILKDVEAMERVANLTMEYHLVGRESLEHLLRILRNLQFQIDFVHSDGEKHGRVRAYRS
jgi:FkbM family methyltransferase